MRMAGERQALSEEAAPLLERIRAIAPVPVALDFGISTPEQVAEAARVADGVIDGSRLVRFLEEMPEGDLAAHVRWRRSGM